MDIHFQDRIDDYLFGRMSEAEKEAFLQEVEQDNEKKEQLEFTRNVKEAVCSREEKLRALTELQRQYENKQERRYLISARIARPLCCMEVGEQEPPVCETEEPKASRRNIWLWISGIAAVLVVGFFAIKPMFVEESSPNFNMEHMRGGDDMFDGAAPVDSTDNDTIRNDIDTRLYQMNK